MRKSLAGAFERYRTRQAMRKRKLEGGPDFIIIGAQKSGTSALRRNLDLHDGIALSEGEAHFFNHRNRWSRGFDWYLDQFQHPDKLQGEKTPDYLDNKQVPGRIASAFPDVKLIALLRDPVTRAYSHWNHMMQKIESSSQRGWELLSFEEAINRALAGDSPFDRLIEKGIYADQLERFLKYFPREQLHIGIQERFRDNGAEELARVFRFLGVEELPIEPEKRHVRSYESPIDPRIKARLLEYYAPHNEKLFKLLGDDIPEWEAP